MWFYIRPEVKLYLFEQDAYNTFTKENIVKNVLHSIIYTSPTKPKRIKLGDAVSTNIYHFLFYMLARFYFVDNGINTIYFYYPKETNYLAEAAFLLLPKRFIRETEEHPNFEYIELPGCMWKKDSIEDSWVYSYVRDLFKDYYESIPQIKGKFTYISRNARECQYRNCENENELINPLKKAGFDIHTLNHLTFLEQIRLFRSSEMITGVHGAGLTWLIFCHPQTVVCEVLRPDDKIHQHHYQDICQQLNLKYYSYSLDSLIPVVDNLSARNLHIPVKHYIECLIHIQRTEKLID